MNRWWEARCSWQTIINCCYSIGAQIAPVLADADASEQALMQLMGFTMALKAHLRGTKISQDEVGERMDWRFCVALNHSCNPPLQALKAMGETVRYNLPSTQKGHAEGQLSSAIYDEISEQIRVINHAVGACMKIKSTPMTFGYVATLRSFLLLWLVTLPMALIGEFGWLGVPALSLIAFLFLNVEQMAVEIEQPFGDDANDLPIEKYIIELEETLLEMVPGFSLSSEEEAEEVGGAQTALEMRVAALEAAHAEQVNILKAELQQERGQRGAGCGEATGIAAMNNWNRISPAWLEEI